MAASSTPLVWLITGTASGFGNCLVASVLARGDRVIATARSLESINHLQGNPNVCVRQLDVTAGAPAIAAIVAEAAGVWGRLDVVVNNAGAGYPGLLEEGGSDLLRKQFAVNFFGVMDVCAASLPFLRAQKSGTIVVVGSRSAWKPELPGLGAYASSKAAVHALAETLTAEVAPLGIRVLLVEPGAFRTGIYGQEYLTSNPIADYNQMRSVSASRFASVSGTEKGDPAKAMDALVDVVRGEGRAHGRSWPAAGRLVLGEDAENDVRVKCKRVLDSMDEWTDVIRGVNFD
ncbi:hypothetical protein DFH08DRAFT_970911 [Mycena albidolilacea]|uniref:Uncharacterized protein n=1 Tax=Mycena albidolilacea TaxID=1033008 RepID=A0AAD6ZE50_9AGAR|nr:hypothetical protein DFH08DRAFT_970911 [Mycena albidolilacea]